MANFAFARRQILEASCFLLGGLVERIPCGSFVLETEVTYLTLGAWCPLREVGILVAGLTVAGKVKR